MNQILVDQIHLSQVAVTLTVIPFLVHRPTLVNLLTVVQALVTVTLTVVLQNGVRHPRSYFSKKFQGFVLTYSAVSARDSSLV